MLQNWNFLIGEIWFLIALAAALTLAICWYMWGRAFARANVHKLRQTEEELTTTQNALIQARAELDRAKDRQEILKERLAREQMKTVHATTSANTGDGSAIRETLSSVRSRFRDLF